MDPLFFLWPHRRCIFPAPDPSESWGWWFIGHRLSWVFQQICWESLQESGVLGVDFSNEFTLLFPGLSVSSLLSLRTAWDGFISSLPMASTRKQSFWSVLDPQKPSMPTTSTKIWLRTLRTIDLEKPRSQSKAFKQTALLRPPTTLAANSTPELAKLEPTNITGHHKLKLAKKKSPGSMRLCHR